MEEESDMEHGTQGLGIHKAISAIKLQLAGGGGVQKGRSAPMGYKFRGIEDFDNILCGMTAEHGVNIYPRVTRREIVHGTTAKGSYQSHVILDVDFLWVCDRDGSSITVSTVGEAMDTQDKACNKAMQAARKYSLVLTLQIPIGGDDTEIYVPEPAAVAQQQGPAAAQPVAAQPVHEPLHPEPAAKRTRGPNKPKETPAEPTPPNYPLTTAKTVEVAPAPPPFQVTAATPVHGTTNDIDDLVARIANVQTFPLLFAICQDADETTNGTPDRDGVFAAIHKRAIHLFTEAKDMKEVQEGFELVNALGQPAEVAAAANRAYGKFRAAR